MHGGREAAQKLQLKELGTPRQASGWVKERRHLQGYVPSHPADADVAAGAAYWQCSCSAQSILILTDAMARPDC